MYPPFENSTTRIAIVEGIPNGNVSGKKQLLKITQIITTKQQTAAQQTGDQGQKMRRSVPEERPYG